MAIRKIPDLIRRAAPFERVARAMRWVFIFAFGFYCGRAGDVLPPAIAAFFDQLR